MKTLPVRVLPIALCAIVLTALIGCQTRITATKHAEVASPIQQVVAVNGADQVITTGYMVTSGGWEATARSPLWADESLDGLTIGVTTNGSVNLAINRYSRDLSTNAVVLTREIFVGSTNLVSAISAAYSTIATAGSPSVIASVADAAYSAFKSAGGDESTAQVSASGGKVTISDGKVCTTCDATGNCTTGSCTDI